ncbi:MAG: BrnT family toxin [Vicinamibacterales bacterium]
MFEWDELKAAANLRKHGVSFDEATTVFADPDALDGPDLSHSDHEPRSLRLGKSLAGRILMLAYTLRRSDNAETIRIISARRASRKERETYRPSTAD